MSNNLLTLDTINKHLGDDFDNIIDRCNNYKEVLLKNQNEVKNKIMSQVVGEYAHLPDIRKKVQNDRKSIKSLIEEVNQLKLKYTKFREETESIRNVFKTLIADINAKSNKITYFICLKSIISISNRVRCELSNKQDNEVIKLYMYLCELSVAMTNAPCKKGFELILKQMNWPFTPSESKDITNLDNLKCNFQHVANILINIRLPESLDKNCTEQLPVTQLLEHFSRVSLPISLMLVTFRKRFFFHFTGKKQTNKPDKPEWFLSRVLSWIRDYRTFITDWLGPPYIDNNRKPVDAQHEFIVGLLQPVVIKLDSDLSHFQLEDVVFSHIVDETLAFEHELRKVYNYPDDYPSVTEVLTQAHLFFKWINMERKYAINKIEEILDNDELWKILVNDTQYKLTTCADNLLTLLNTMTDRYSILRQPRHKLQFLKLQTDLLEEFKTKIIDGYHTRENQNTVEDLQQLLCTLHYICYVLYNWGTNMHFLALLNYKCELETEVRNRSESEHTEILENADTVFDETIRLYYVEIDSLLEELCGNVLIKVKRSAKNYKRDRWHIMSSLSDNTKYSITDSGWVMYETFAENLDLLSKNLPIALFNKSWPILSTKLSEFIISDILMANMFNKGGAQHLKCDVQYKMLPIISKYTTKPNIYAERLLEACNVLCFEPNFQPTVLTHNEVSEILLRRIEHGNSIELG
ncbi:RAD50-interacting protein 1 isoform X2 [Adelges cooleyi]|uniref:RAD50-interacting protein 1 isoform X2 n=1 Tax=Adelges cooleyi TaxID=133065 RepID=UPI00217F8A33|nr:RAD50-interacting protein 1 isoform X2 [Adelges cooleyi]